MKRLICLCYTFCLLGILTFSGHAQTGDSCLIDLSAAAASLVQAQARASSGDTAAAIAKIRELQAQLDAIVANCDGATSSTIQPTPAPAETNQPSATATAPPIPTRFTASNGILSFRLPAGWVSFEQGNSVFIGTSTTTAQGLGQFTPPIGDNLGAGLVLGTTKQLAPTVRTGANFVDVLVAYQSQLRLGGFSVSEELTPTTWQNNPAGRFIFQNTSMSGIMQVIEFEAEANGLHLLVFVVSAPSNSGQLETSLTDLLDSIEIALP